MERVAKRISVPDKLMRDVREGEASAEWVRTHWPALRKYTNRFIAVEHRRVVATATSERVLRRRFNQRRTVYITFVPPKG